MTSPETHVNMVMDPEPEVSHHSVVTTYNTPFKILSEKQLEWMQFKAKQKLLELKEEEEWKKYCQEQNSSDIENNTTTHNPVDADDESTKVTENVVKSVSTEQTNDKKKKTKGAKTPVIVYPNKGRGTACETTSPVLISHFQKTRVESPFSLPASVKLNVLKVQKQSSGGDIYSGDCDGEDRENIVQSTVPVTQRIIKSVVAPDLEYDELSGDLSEVLLYPKVNRNIGFTLPYSLKQQRYLARKAYLPSFPRPNVYRKNIPMPPNKSTTGTFIAERNPTGTAGSRNINQKVQNSSSFKTKKLKVKENKSTKHEKQNVKEKTKSVSMKEKKLKKLQKDVSRNVVELLLDEMLDEVISKVEREEEEKKKRLMFSQLNNILQKLNDIENEESAIHRKWKTSVMQKSHREDVSLIHSPSRIPIDVPQSSGAVQEKFIQSTMDVIVREALKNSEVHTHGTSSEAATIIRMPQTQNSAAEKHLPEDAKALYQHPSQQNLTQTEADKQTTAMSDTTDFLNFKSEREIGVTSESLQRIYNYRKCFRQYLKKSSEISKQHCNFWNVSTELADEILEECLQDVAEELCEIPSSLIVDLYNQEFQHSHVHL